MAKLLTETADYDEDGSWGRMSDGWPSIKGQKAHDMCVFANCIDTIPYGSYVLMDNECLRVHADYIEQIREDFKNAGEPNCETSIDYRERTGKLLSSGNRAAAPKWW